jgi:hypothetical protein
MAHSSTIEEITPASQAREFIQKTVQHAPSGGMQKTSRDVDCTGFHSWGRQDTFAHRCAINTMIHELSKTNKEQKLHRASGLSIGIQYPLGGRSQC